MISTASGPFPGRGRFQQQSDGIAALSKIMAVAAQSCLRIEALRPGARRLFGTEEGGGADVSARRQDQRR